MRHKKTAAPSGAARYENFGWLRICLAYGVLVMHCTRAADWIFGVPVPSVGVFVCLSGFLIPTSFESSRNGGHFWWKRGLRVLPGMLLSLGLVAALGYAVKPVLVNYITIAMIGTLSVNRPIWTLAAEEILYGFHSLSKWLKVWGKPLTWGVVVALFSLWVWLLVTDKVYPVWKGGQSLPYPVTIAGAFFIGNLLNLYADKVIRIGAWHAVLIFAVHTFLFLYADSVFWSLGRIAEFTYPASFIVLAMRLPQVKFKLPDVSYGVYIYHWPIMLFLYSDLTRTLMFTTCVAVTSWFLVESKALELKSLTLPLKASFHPWLQWVQQGCRQKLSNPPNPFPNHLCQVPPLLHHLHHKFLRVPPPWRQDALHRHHRRQNRNHHHNHYH